MQTVNINYPIHITTRKGEPSVALNKYIEEKIYNLKLDYPKIIEAKVVVQSNKTGHHIEIILFCSNHISIDVSEVSRNNMYTAVDKAVSKIARRMRKQKTRLLKRKRNTTDSIVKHLEEKIYDENILSTLPWQEELKEDPQPSEVQRERVALKKLNKEDAIVELELSDKPFFVYISARRNVLQIVYKNRRGDFIIIEPNNN